MFKEFKEFAIKGSVVDMAVGIVIGAAFGAIVNSFVADILMPPIGLLIGNVDFSNLYIILKEGSIPGPYPSLIEAKKAGAVLWNYGLFINTVINFIIIAFAIYIVVRAINRLKRQEAVAAAAPSTKECPYCLSNIPINAIKCAYCTSDLKQNK